MSYQCLICLDEYPVGPVLTSCHHIYCHACLTQCESVTCPTCRDVIIHEHIQFLIWEQWLEDPDQTKFPKDYRSRSAETYYNLHQNTKRGFSRELQQSAKYGSDLAKYDLGEFYFNQKLIKKACQYFDDISLDWLKQNLSYSKQLAKIYLDLDSPNLERTQHIMELDQTANGWNRLGVFFGKLKKNPNKERECYEKALELEPNNPNILENYALAILDTKKRIELLTKCQSKRGFYLLSFMYLVGDGVETSFPLSLEYIWKAMQNSLYHRALFALCEHYEHGWGTPKNPQKVDELFNQYQIQLKPNLKVWYYTRRRQFKRIRDMEKSCQTKDVTKSRIGDIYRLGKGGPKDMKKAMEYYLQDYNTNHDFGIVRLASFPNEYQEQAWEKLQRIKIKTEFTELPIFYKPHMFNPNLMFDIGKVFLNHGEFTKACQWFEKAKLYGSDKAPVALDILQLSNLGKPTKRKNETT